MLDKRSGIVIGSGIPYFWVKIFRFPAACRPRPQRPVLPGIQVFSQLQWFFNPKVTQKTLIAQEPRRILHSGNFRLYFVRGNDSPTAVSGSIIVPPAALGPLFEVSGHRFIPLTAPACHFIDYPMRIMTPSDFIAQCKG